MSLFRAINKAQFDATEHAIRQIPQTRRDFYRELHAVADKARPAVRRQFLQAVQGIQEPFMKERSTSFQELQAAVEAGNPRLVVNRLGMEDRWARELQPMVAELQGVLAAAAVASEAELGLAGVFDLVNPRTVRFLQQYKFDLISPVSVSRTGQNIGVTAQTIEGIREVVRNAFEQGGHPRAQARTIRDLVGLNRRQARAWFNFRETLAEEGRAPAKIDVLSDKHYDRLVRARALTIARTETIRAANAGQHTLWAQAAEEGLIDRQTARRQWVVTPDDVLCPICRAIPGMNQGGVGLNEPFQSDVGPLLHPTAHPRCRCAVALVVF